MYKVARLNGGVSISRDSEFARNIKEVIRLYKPNRLLETGTFLGEGTTRIIAEELVNVNKKAHFVSLEVSKEYARRAKDNLLNHNLIVDIRNGLSIPKQLLPGEEEIKKSVMDGPDNIYVDHEEKDRLDLYLKEIKYDGKDDDLIGKVLNEWNGKVDFVLLDSAGCLGYVEFKYLLSKVKFDFVLVLDDVKHIKHCNSAEYIKESNRFKIIKVSDEKFGFLIASFRYI